jgi:hypothetical protein
MSMDAPLETSPVFFSSAIRPPQSRASSASEPLEAVAVRSFSGRLNVAPMALAARDDRHLVQRVGVVEQRLQHRVARLVVGGASLFSSPRPCGSSARPNFTLSRASSRSSCSMNSLFAAWR